MKPQQHPPSFTLFQPIDDPQFIQYLETYCLELDKKQKEIQQKSKNWALFMEEDLAEANLNGFSKHFSRPSINCFDFKDYVGSIENIPRCSILKQQLQPCAKTQFECKIQEENQKQNMINASQNERRVIGSKLYTQKLKRENKRQTEETNLKRVKRLNEIMLNVDLVKRDLQKLMEDFDF